jgi:hypothetical protein
MHVRASLYLAKPRIGSALFITHVLRAVLPVLTQAGPRSWPARVSSLLSSALQYVVELADESPFLAYPRMFKPQK